MAATKRKMDFTNVKDGGGNFRPRRRPEGDYEAKIVKVDDHQPKDSDKEMGWVFTVQIKGDARSSYPIYGSPTADQAWKIRKLFIACGMAVPKKMVLVDPNKLVGRELGVILVDDEYNGKIKSSIDDFIPVDDLQGNDNDATDDDDEDEEPPARTKKSKKRPEPEPEDDEEDEDDDDDEPEPPKKKAKKAARRKAPEPEDDEDDEDDEPPAKKRKAVKKSKKRRDEDEDLDIDEL